MDLYRDFIIALYKNPLNKRVIPNADITHSGANITCGDRVRIYVKLNQDSISDISFEGEGCAITLASASLLTEHAKGKSLEEITNWNAVTVCSWLETELGPARIKCGMLPLETLQEGIKKCQIVLRAAQERSLKGDLDNLANHLFSKTSSDSLQKSSSKFLLKN